MNKIAYAIIASTGLVVTSFASGLADKFVSAATFMFFSAMCAFKSEK